MGFWQIKPAAKTLYRSFFIDDDILHCILWVLSFYGLSPLHRAVRLWDTGSPTATSVRMLQCCSLYDTNNSVWFSLYFGKTILKKDSIASRNPPLVILLNLTPVNISDMAQQFVTTWVSQAIDCLRHIYKIRF